MKENNNGKRWKTADIVVGFALGVLGIAQIVTGLKSSNYDQEQQYKELEDRYGLTPVNNQSNEEES